MTVCIALLRGINVGKAKRLAMADLRELLTEAGCTQVRTLLNSGNAVFETARPEVNQLAVTLAVAIEERLRFQVPVVVLTAQDLNAIVAANTLPQAAQDPSRFLVAFFANGGALSKATPLLGQAWAPDAFAMGNQAAYLWCVNGVIESPLSKAFSRAMGDSVTSRNWATVLKLQALCAAGAMVP